MANPWSPVEQFKARQGGNIDALMAHFESRGTPFESEDHLLADMLDDVIDIWTDDHLGSLDEGCTNVNQA